MRQTKIVIGLEQHQLLPHAVLPLAQRGDTPPHCRHPLPDVQVEPLDKGRLDLPATGRQHLCDACYRPEHHAVAHADQMPAPHGLDHLRVEQLRQRHPTRLRCGACATWWTTCWAIASVRFSTSIASSSLLSGSMATQ